MDIDDPSVPEKIRFSIDDIFLHILNHSPSIILLFSKKGDVLLRNKVCEKTFEMRHKSMRIKEFLEKIEFKDRSIDFQNLKRPLNALYSTVKVNNKILSIKWNICPIAYKNGKADLILMIGQDISELKKSKFVALYMEKIIDILPGVMWWKDVEGHYVGCNQAMLKVCQLTSKKDFIGKTDYDMPWTREESDHYVQDDRIVMQTRKAKLNIEETQTFPDGRETVLLTNKVPVFDEYDNVIGTLGTFLDITERKQKEIELYLTNEKLSKAIKEIESARELQDKLRNELVTSARLAGMAEVATSVLHNVGNILNSVNTSVFAINNAFKNLNYTKLEKVVNMLSAHQSDIGEYLSKHPQGMMVIPYLKAFIDHVSGQSDEIAKEIMSLNKNIEHIVEIISTQQSLGATGGFSESVSLPNLINNAITINAGSQKKMDVEIILDYHTISEVIIDRVKIMQILVNIIKNSIESFSGIIVNDKQISIKLCDLDNENFCIQISDNGVGISAKNKSKIFTHGFTTKEKGHGFGLHNSILSANEMGGTIVAESEGLGKGATFKIILPYQPPAK